MSRDPERAARTMLARHAVTTAPVEVEAIALAEDIRLIWHGGDGAEFGFVMRPGNGMYEVSRTTIGVNSRRSARRQRLAIAHQLGHVMLHRELLDTLCFDVRNGCQKNEPSMHEEAEANAFSGELLMPRLFVEDAVRGELGAVTSRKILVRRFAAVFGVPVETATWRLLNLGVLT